MKKLFVILLSSVMLISYVLPSIAADLAHTDIRELYEGGMSPEEISEKYEIPIKEVVESIISNNDENSSDDYDPDTAVPFSSQIYTNLEFDHDIVLVTLKHEYSKYEIEYNVEDFPELELVSVEAPLKEYNKDNAKWGDHSKDYKEILILTLKGAGKENVIEAVKNLEHRADDDLYFVGLNYHYTWFPGRELLGDANADGRVNMKDAMIIAKHVASWKLYFDESNADANGDGEINVKDASEILRKIANS